MRWLCALVGLGMAGVASAEPFEVRPAVKHRVCQGGVDYYVNVDVPVGRSLAVGRQQARSRATQILVDYLFGTETGGTAALNSRESEAMAVKIDRFSRTDGVLRNMVHRSRKVVGSKMLFVYTLSYSDRLSREVDELVCRADQGG